MIFETKKIQLETLSEYLTEVRESLGLSVEEVSKKAAMKQKFLESLEQGKFDQLPADVYVLGFLQALARLYSLDPSMLTEQFKKERGIERQLQKKSRSVKPSARPWLGRIVITPKYVSILLGLLFVGVTLGYIVWQVLSINKTPSLEITEPQDRQLIKDTVVNVRGKTDPGTNLSLNDQNVFVDEQGNFKTQVGVNAGPETLIFVAKNKFDKSASQTLTVIGEQQAATSTQNAVSAVQLKLEFSGNVSIDVTIDDGNTQTYAFQAGDTKTITASNKIVLSISNAGATKATLNNQPLGVLGRAGEKLVNVPFMAQPGSIPAATSTP